MRKFVLFAMLAVALSARSQIITATLTVTNTAGTTNGETLTINGNLRFFSNNVPSFFYILSGTNIGLATTNIYTAYASHRESAAQLFVLSATNSIIWQSFPGAALTVAPSAGWATVSYSTNSTTNATVVRVPYTVEGTGQRTTIANGVVDWVNLGTTQIPSSRISNVVDTFNNFQTIGGSKTFTSSVTFSGIISATSSSQSSILNLSVSNLVIPSNGRLTGTIANSTITGSTIIGPTLSNAVNVGTAFSSVGTKVNSEQFGSGAVATGTNSTAIGAISSATATQSTAIGYGAVADGFDGTALGSSSAADGFASIAIANGSAASGSNSIAIGASSTCAYDNSIALGVNATATAANQIMLGTPTIDVVVNHVLTVGDSISNSVFKGNTTNSSSWSWLRTNNTGLANGNNANVQIGLAQNVHVSGPTGAFSINGIAAGREGQWVKIWNRTGQAMTIANQSGVDPTAANRIETGIGADIIVTNNPGIVELHYDATAARWSMF